MARGAGSGSAFGHDRNHPTLEDRNHRACELDGRRLVHAFHKHRNEGVIPARIDDTFLRAYHLAELLPHRIDQLARRFAHRQLFQQALDPHCEGTPLREEEIVYQRTKSFLRGDDREGQRKGERKLARFEIDRRRRARRLSDARHHGQRAGDQDPDQDRVRGGTSTFSR